MGNRRIEYAQEYRNKRNQETANVAQTRATTSSILTQQAQQLAKLDEWKETAHIRMQKMESEAQKAEAEAGLKEHENETKERVFLANQKKRDAEAKSAEITADYAEEKIETDIAATKATASAATTNAKANLTRAEATYLSELNSGTDPTYGGKEAHKMSNKFLLGMLEDGKLSQSAIDSAVASAQLYTGDISSGAFQGYRNRVAAIADDLGLKVPDWIQDPTKLSGQEAVAAFHKKFLGQLILVGGRGISESDAQTIAAGLQNTANTEEANIMISQYQRHQAVMMREKESMYSRMIQNEDKFASDAISKWNDTYGRDFVSVYVTGEGKLKTFTDFKQRYIAAKRADGVKGIIEDKEIAEGWAALYYPQSELIHRAK